MKIEPKDIQKIQKLVGNITEGNLKYVDCYVSDNMGIFIPSVGYCEYAVTPQHTHPAYSFLLFLSKEQKIVSCKIEVPPEHYLMTGLSPDFPHEENQTEYFTRYIAILISKELFETQYSIYSRQPPENYFWNQFVIGQDIMPYLKRFMSEYENMLPGSESVLEALAMMITHQLIRSILKVHGTADYITERLEIEKALEYMHQHYGQRLSVSKLAKIVNMSPSHFIRIFKKETDSTPMEYLIKLRIDKAKKLLRSGAKKITEISLECGFNSTSHFSSCFAKHLGISPSEYQNSFYE
ncbi:MAG: AraC family transcriptional regulator [Clostridia bacterium]|nr:AraC family transcriptional regulator [Clostridia bacterium]